MQDARASVRDAQRAPAAEVIGDTRQHEKDHSEGYRLHGDR